jgi:hypothetical protein
MDIGPDFFLEVLCLGIYSQSVEAVRVTDEALEVYHAEVAENSMMNDQISRLYMSILSEIKQAELDPSNPAEIAAMLMKFKHNPDCDRDPTILTNINTIFDNRDKVSPRRIAFITKKIKNWIIWTRSNASIRKVFGMSQQAACATDPLKQDLLIGEMLAGARDLVASCESREGPINSAPIEEIDMTCPISVKKGLIAHENKRGARAIIKSGLQGYNRMFGGGNARGEFGAFAALSHHYKSGLLMDMARWTATLNKPLDTDVGIPTIVFVSLENEVYENLMMWFVQAYENLTGGSCPKDMSFDQIIDYVTEIYSRNGFKLMVYRKMGDYFGYDEWVKLHTDLEATGHRIITSFLDYITLMSVGDGQENGAKKLQILGNRIGNYCNHHSFLCITGLQLNGEAEILAASGQVNIVKRYGAAHLADCKGFKKELDFLAYLHIETNHIGVKYLTVKLDKHKYVHDTPEEYKYFAYRFTPKGIMDDINGECKASYNIYADDESDNDGDGDGLTMF